MQLVIHNDGRHMVREIGNANVYGPIDYVVCVGKSQNVGVVDNPVWVDVHDTEGMRFCIIYTYPTGTGDLLGGYFMS